MSTNRVPKGVPTGGQFAASGRAESAGQLASTDPRATRQMDPDRAYELLRSVMRQELPWVARIRITPGGAVECLDGDGLQMEVDQFAPFDTADVTLDELAAPASAGRYAPSVDTPRGVEIWLTKDDGSRDGGEPHSDRS